MPPQVRELVWSLQTQGPNLKIGWDEFIAFAEKEEHVPTNEEEWQRVQEVLAMLDIELPEIR
eukprot:COSAG01_NODE_20285_length_961_cov_2.642453_2_plen_62_part_00